METNLHPMLLISHPNGPLTWRFMTELDAQKARVLARMNNVPYVERWGALPVDAGFTRRSEYEAVLKILAHTVR